MFDANEILNCYYSIKEKSLYGRHIYLNHIGELIHKFSNKKIGSSELNKPIYKLRIGNGERKILIWSQMHGNESTGTKSMFDVLNYLTKKDDYLTTSILDHVTIIYVPILNPDGAKAYTRVNAKEIDLNRDAVDLSAKESNILRGLLEELNPDFCFNLHDQRTIFGVDGTENSAVLSFLAPSTEESRKITNGRIQTMNVISSINTTLQELLPNQIGRYTDEFYPTATGDNFQRMGYNTILIESGHYPNDYDREVVRKFTFLSIIKGLYHIATENNFDDPGNYFSIPNNKKNFLDVAHKNLKNIIDAYQYEEVIIKNTFTLIPKKVNKEEAKNKLFHKEIVFVDA